MQKRLNEEIYNRTQDAIEDVEALVKLAGVNDEVVRTLKESLIRHLVWLGWNWDVEHCYNTLLVGRLKQVSFKAKHKVSAYFGDLFRAATELHSQVWTEECNRRYKAEVISIDED